MVLPGRLLPQGTVHNCSHDRNSVTGLCTCVCTGVCVHGRVCTWVRVCMGACVHGHVCARACVHVGAHVCMGVCARGCVCTCVQVGVRVHVLVLAQHVGLTLR